jgi:uncharacterized MnhB-related membrane protein
MKDAMTIGALIWTLFGFIAAPKEKLAQAYIGSAIVFAIVANAWRKKE